MPGKQFGRMVDAEEFARHDHRRHLRSLDHIDGLGCRVAGVEGDQHPARVLHAQCGDRPVIAVGRPDGHPAADLEPRRDKRRGKLADALEQLRIRQLDALVPLIPLAIDDRLLRRPYLRRPDQRRGRRLGAPSRRLGAPSRRLGALSRRLGVVVGHYRLHGHNLTNAW